MMFLGMSIPELAALLGMLSLIVGALAKFYQLIRRDITAPLITALDKLRMEISQLETYLVNEYKQLKQRTEKLDKRVIRHEREVSQLKEGHHDYRMVDEG